MPRAVPRLLVSIGVTLCVAIAVDSAQAESKRAGARVLVLPLLGPGGMTIRNVVVAHLKKQASLVRPLGKTAGNRLRQLGRRHRADAIVGGRLRCRGNRCKVTVVVYRRTGKVWRTVVRRSLRGGAGQTAAQLSEKVLTELGVLEQEEPQVARPVARPGGHRGPRRRQKSAQAAREARQKRRRAAQKGKRPPPQGTGQDTHRSGRRQAKTPHGDPTPERGSWETERDQATGWPQWPDSRPTTSPQQAPREERRRASSTSAKRWPQWPQHQENQGPAARDGRGETDGADTWEGQSEADSTQDWSEQDSWGPPPPDETTSPSQLRATSADERRYDALEVYFDVDIVLSNNLCVDVKLQTTADDDVCLLDRPNVDDRTYGVSPYPGLGFRFTVFPGAFGRNQGWWAHVGLYADFARSLNLKTSKDYEGVDSNSLRVWVPTYQQDLRAGIVARIPLGSPVRPQFRVAAGVGFFELFLDDEAYPDDREITLAFRPANPYIPSFAYLTADVGLELRIPFRIEPLAYIFPYSSVFYRRGIDYFNRVVAGADVISQAARVYGVSAAVNGVDWELGARLELALGIRIHVAFNLLWYGTDFAGNADYASEEEEALWNQTALGNRAQEMLVRLRLGVGWSF